jgi:glycosyltransferase involved in cell wall biosynthesis
MLKRDTVFLFTYSFPFGTGEAFLETEIMYLTARYKRVFIAPLRKTENCRSVPDNVELLDVGGLYRSCSKKKTLVSIFSAFQIFFFQLVYSKRRSVYVKRFRYYLSYLINETNVAQDLSHILACKKNNDAIYYSYWFDYLMLPLSILRKQGKINCLITRAHGGDVYEYQHEVPNFFFLFRSFQIRQADVICPISLDGIHHLKEHYPLSAAKLRMSRLGVVSSNVINNSPNKEIVIVTCSFFKSYKRLHLVPLILKHLHFQAKWIHLGGEGELKNEIMELAKQVPANIEVVFKGHLSNSEVLHFYEKTPVSLFLNVSISEGIPVSIMEAISFGIPVIATDVGGVKEVVTGQTGSLLDRNFLPEQAAQLIRDNISRYSSDVFRQGVKLFWNNNFNAETNYLEFIDGILPS